MTTAFFHTPPNDSPQAAGEAALTVDQARARIAERLQPVAGAELVGLDDALGRVLAADLDSPMDVPPHDNAAMDGFALRGAELRADAETVLRIAGCVLAGHAAPPAAAPGECVRIMTGAVMPPGLDTVVPLELCREEAGATHIPAGAVRPGDHRRHRGEDLAQGRPALHAGRVLRPADLGLAASLGCTRLSVRRPLRVALFSTGDELCEPGQPLAAGCIYDSNRRSLAAALRRMGPAVQVTDLGLVPDDPARLEATLARALGGGEGDGAGADDGAADVVLTSGGVSMGDADHTRALLARLGEVAFWKVAMRPGRPFAFGPLRRPGGGAAAWLFALPGNPVAALVSFHVFVQEALWVLAGARHALPPRLPVPSAQAIRKRPGRTEFQRAIVEPAPGGGWHARLTGSQGSGILRSMSEANALLVLGHAQGDVAPGEPVQAWLLDGLA